MKWPNEVPVLGHENFCRGAFESGRNRCMTGWAHEVFAGDPIPTMPSCIEVDKKIEPVIVHSLRELKASRLDEDYEYVGIPAYNDNPRNPKALLARAWNRAMARLGYTVDNPECFRNGKLKPVK